MKLLAIESASEQCSVALGIGNSVFERSRHAPREHASLLLPWVEALLAEGGLRLADLDALAFSRGPGSFTSLRIGIAVSQGLAWGADLPVIPVSSLASAAQAAADGWQGPVMVALDARMNEVYCARFVRGSRGDWEPEGDERVCGPEEAASLADEHTLGIGNGFERYSALAGITKRLARVEPDAWPQARGMLPLARSWLSHRPGLPPAQAQPVYLRDKVAEKPE